MTGCAFLLAAVAVGAFEKVAFVDGSDFATQFDVETRAGVGAVLDHVALTGADTMLWRTHSGAMPRYRSRFEAPCRMDHPVDAKRLPNCSEVHSWMRLWRATVDPLAEVFDECARRPQFTTRGFHMLLEEAHWQFQYLGEWNMRHPQYWCRKSDRSVQMYHASFAFPEVMSHRLDIVGELLERAPDVLYYDSFRNGGYAPPNDFVRPNVEAWKRRHPDLPMPKSGHDPNWREWVKLCGERQYAYLEGVRTLIAAHGGKTRLMTNVEGLEDNGESHTERALGISWRELLGRNLVDAIAVTSFASDKNDPFGSTERFFRAFMREVDGRTKVYFPLLNYNFSERRPSYGQLAKWGGVSEAESVRRLMAMADRFGAAGVVMECVDYRNYSDDVCAVIRNYRRGDWQKVYAELGRQEAQVSEREIESACMRKKVPVSVILPPGYADGTKRYPVAYMLHGAGNDQRTYAVKPIRDLAAKHDVIVVAPYGGNSWWMDAPEFPAWKYESFVVKELVPWVDAQLRTLPERKRRLIVGHSMGGQGACRIGFRHKDLFAHVGNVMGGVDIAAFPERKDLQRILGPMEENPQRWRDYSVLAEAAKLRDGDVSLTSVVGSQDFFLDANRRLHALLASNGVSHAYAEITGTDKEHSSHTRTFAYAAMPRIFSRFADGNLTDRFVREARAAYRQHPALDFTLAPTNGIGLACFHDHCPGVVRWIEVPNIRNVRDIGGWTGLRMGRAFRGTELDNRNAAGVCVTEEGRAKLVGELGVKTDLDLRRDVEVNGRTDSPLGAGVRFVHASIEAYAKYSTTTNGYAKALRVFADPANYPIYFHCFGGADRTGVMAFLLEGLCGVDLADACVDYELTTLGWRTRKTRSSDEFRSFYARIDREPGLTFELKTRSFVRRQFGLSDFEIDAIRRNLMVMSLASAAVVPRFSVD